MAEALVCIAGTLITLRLSRRAANGGELGTAVCLSLIAGAMAVGAVINLILPG